MSATSTQVRPCLAAHLPDDPIAKHATACTEILGSRSDLLLWLTNGKPAGPLDVIGNTETARRWRELRR